MGLYWGYFSGSNLDSEKMFLFNREQITRVYALGYQDEEQIAFKKKAEEIIEEIRKE